MNNTIFSFPKPANEPVLGYNPGSPERKAIREALPDGKAHVVVRNFPAEAAALQKQLGLREGGDRFIIATTVASRRTAFLCHTK